MSSYWRQARIWAFKRTKAYAWPRAVPSVLVAAVQYWWLGLRSAGQTVTIAVTILGVYAVLYCLDFLWKLSVQAPVALDDERVAEIEQLRAQLDTEAKPTRSRAEQLRLEEAKRELERFDLSERVFLEELLKRGEMRYEDLKQNLTRSGLSDHMWSSAVEKAKAGILVEFASPSPTRQHNALRIRPSYSDALWELLHPER